MNLHHGLDDLHIQESTYAWKVCEQRVSRCYQGDVYCRVVKSTKPQSVDEIYAIKISKWVAVSFAYSLKGPGEEQRIVWKEVVGG